MLITKQVVASKLSDYLSHQITLPQLVDWAESVMMNDQDQLDNFTETRDVVAHLGLADVRAFGLNWEDCEEFLKRLGYSTHVDIRKVA